MKNTLRHSFAMLFLTLALGALSTQTLNAQATNSSGEAWTIYYYGAQTVVPNNSTPTTISIGSDCTQGIRVRNDPNSCGTDFTGGPGTWGAPCSSNTSNVEFTGDAGAIPGTSFCAYTTYINPVFIFE